MTTLDDRKIQLVLEILGTADYDIVKDYEDIENAEDPQMIEDSLNEMLAFVDQFEVDVLRKE